MMRFPVMTCLLVLLTVLPAAAESYELQVLPSEQKQIKDPVTGTELTFLTTAPGKDTHTYIYQPEWLSDGSAILFNSDRNQGGAMAYIVRTGELVKLATPSGVLHQPVASVKRPVLFARRGREVVEARLSLAVSDDPKGKASSAQAEVRSICTLPESTGSSYMTENPDGTKLSLGIAGIKDEHRSAIFAIDVASGEIKEVCNFPDPPALSWHVQWSWTDPNLILFAGLPQRLMAVDIRDGKPRNLYKALDDELVTHESSWVNGQVLFCGGTHPKPTEDAHVKVLDLATGVVRIVGAGAWWPGGTAAELAKVNWWHSSGSRDGRWVAADNWHGDITIWEAKTTRPRLLTTGHRTYGHGEHPHVCWDQASKAVIFTSEMLGDPNVCVATIPEKWQAENPWSGPADTRSDVREQRLRHGAIRRPAGASYAVYVFGEREGYTVARIVSHEDETQEKADENESTRNEQAGAGNGWNRVAMDWLTLFQRCFDADRVYYTRYARFEMEADEFGRILDEEVHQAILAGELIREYVDDMPYPSVLLLGRTRQDRPLHIVCAYGADEDRAFVITVYQPDPVKWIDFKTRRTT